MMHSPSNRNHPGSTYCLPFLTQWACAKCRSLKISSWSIPTRVRDTGSLRPWRLPSLCLTRESQLGSRFGVHSQSLGSSQGFVHLFCYVLIFYQVLSTRQFKGMFLLNSLEYVLFWVTGVVVFFLFFLTGLQNVFKIHCAKDVQKFQHLIFFITLHFGDYGNKDFFTWYLVPFSHSWRTQRQLGRMLHAFSLPWGIV